ncbi:MAG: hypothetical protein ACI4UN_09705 [Muribaculaceae bacterium]
MTNFRFPASICHFALSLLMLLSGSVMSAKQLSFDFYLYPTTTTVEVKNNQFYVNNQAFFVKGAACNSRNSVSSGENPFWAEAAAAGANTIRTYSPYDLGSTKDEICTALGKLYSMNLHVLMGVSIAAEADGFDYTNATARANQISSVKAQIDLCKEHPAILAWCIGNECDQVIGTGSVNTNVWTDINELAAYVKSADGRPVATAITGIWSNRTTVADIKANAPNLDFLCVNNYEGAVESLHSQWSKSGIGIPYIISEFGPRGTWDSAVTANDYGCLFEPSSGEKAASYRTIYQNCIATHSTDGCAGSCVFLWGYQTHGAVQTWYTMFDHYSGYALPAVDVMREMWSGTADADRCPVIASAADLKIDGATTGATITLNSASTHTATVVASDPDGDAITYEWRIVRDETLYGKPITGSLIGTTATGSLTFTAPGTKGNYRLIVYARDEAHGKTACASLPFTVPSGIGVSDGLPSDGNTDVHFAPAIRPKSTNLHTPGSKGIILNYSENLISAPDTDGGKHLFEYMTTNGIDAYMGEWSDALQLGNTSTVHGSAYITLGSTLAGVSRIDITASVYNANAIMKVGMGKRNASNGEFDFTNTFQCTAIDGENCSYVTPSLTTGYRTYTFTPTSGTADGQIVIKDYSGEKNYLRIKAITITYTSGVEVMKPVACNIAAWMEADNEWSRYASFSSERDMVISSANSVVGTVRVADGKAQFLALPVADYAVTAANAANATITGYYIPANTGVVVRTHSGESCIAGYFPTAHTEAKVYPQNNLVAVANTETISAETGHSVYRLTYDNANSTSNAGFYRSNSFVAETGTAYLDVAGNDAAPAYTIADFDMINSGIQSLVAVADDGSDYYYATFSNLDSDMELIADYGASLVLYDVKVEDSALTLTPRADCKVAQGEGVLLRSSAEAFTAIPISGENLVAATAAVTDLVATPATPQTVTAPSGFRLYRLAYDNKTSRTGLGFYWGNNDGSQIAAQPGKAYLQVAVASGAAQVKGFRLGDASTLHIEGVSIDNDTNDADGTIYDLSGRRVENPAPGFYIQGGKKMIIRK